MTNLLRTSPEILDMIQSVKNDSVHLKQIQTISESDAMFSSELNDEMPILNGYNIDRLFKSIYKKRLVLIHICTGGVSNFSASRF